MALTQNDIKPNYILINKTKDTKTGKIIHSTKHGDIRKVIYCNDIVKYLDHDYIQSVSYSTISRMSQKYYKNFDGVNLHFKRKKLPTNSLSVIPTRYISPILSIYILKTKKDIP
jgi:hypothetical protein